MSVSSLPPGFIPSTSDMTSEDRVKAARADLARMKAIKEEVLKGRDYDSIDDKYEEVKASRPNIDVKQVLAAANAKIDALSQTVKIVFEMHTPQGTIKVDSGGGFSTDSSALGALVYSAWKTKHDSGELAKPANASEGVSQLVDLITSMFGKTGETSQGIEPVLELNSSRGTASLLSDGSIKSSGDVSSVIEQLLLPGNALSAKPGTSLEQIISDRTNVLQALFGILA